MSNAMTWRMWLYLVLMVLWIGFFLAVNWVTWSQLAFVAAVFAVFSLVAWRFFPVYFGLKEAPPRD